MVKETSIIIIGLAPVNYTLCNVFSDVVITMVVSPATAVGEKEVI